MSVFQLQEWWSVKMSEDEEFDHGCMVVGNIDNSEPAAEKIAVGSLQGMLRIYAPTKPQFRVEDLILEESLGQPILQLLLGRFIPSSTTLGLAVLHPKKLAVYELVPQGNRDGRVNFYSLRKAYAHDLGLDGKHFTAYNMNSGSFGGARDREMIIVQSMDGKLQIFEQSANAFTRQMADCLIPGPVAYVPKVDAFVTVNHACQAECYRYQVLASSQADIGAKEAESKSGNGLRSIRSAMVEWSMHIGEPCRQILEGHFSSSPAASDSNNRSSNNLHNDTRRSGSVQSELLVLCDKSLFLLKGETGGVIQQRRLERADASCMCIVPASVGGRESGGSSGNFLLAGQDATVQVYSGFNLVWAAKVPTVPVQMAVTSFGNQKGLIVCMDDSGGLSINYMGTRPPMNSVMKQVRDLDYDQVETEHRALLQVIRDSQNENKVEQTDKLHIRPQYPKSIENESPAGVSLPTATLVPLFNNLVNNGNNNNNEGPYVKILVRLYLSYSGDKPATQVSLTIDTPGAFHIVPKNIILSKVAGVKNTPLMVKVFFYATKNNLPSVLDAVVTASYVSHNGEPRVTSIPLNLPMFVACKPKAPVKAAHCKVILDTEFAAQPLTEVFGDFLFAYQQSGMDVAEVLGNNAAQALGFQLFAPVDANISTGGSPLASSLNLPSGPAIVSILVSKNAGRYRIQGDSYPAMLLVLEELERRLQARIISQAGTNSAATGDSAVSLVKCADALPLEQYFAVINAHFQARVRINELTAQLNDVAHQYRMVEKRLLVRYKDRNPTPLGGLDALMKETYDRLIAISDSVQEQQNLLRKCYTELEGFSKFLTAMAALKYGMTYGDRALLKSYLCPDLKEGSEQGWEETVNASITYLLKTSLAKNTKESASLSGTTLELPSSIETLKKHILLLFDRLEKGGKLTVTPTSPTAAGGGASSHAHSSAAPSKGSSRSSRQEK
eukprot:gene11289-13134_t